MRREVARPSRAESERLASPRLAPQVPAGRGGVSLLLCSSGSSSLGRARPCQGRGSGFEARLPLHTSLFELGHAKDQFEWWPVMDIGDFTAAGREI